MPNQYYNESWSAAQGSQGRSRAVDSQFVAIERGFDLIDAALQELYPALGRRFTNLLDCPQTTIGAALKSVRVNAGETALEFVSGGRVPVKSIGGTSYALQAADAGSLLLTTNPLPVMVTVPPGVFQQGEIICLNQYNAGQVTFAPGAGVTINSSDNLLKTRKQHAQVALECLGSDVFTLIGERNAPSLGGFALVEGGNAYTGAQSVAFRGLAYASTINTDAALSNHFDVTLSGNATLANPTNLRDGVILNYWIAQDVTGSRTLSYGSLFKFAGGVPALSTAGSSLDLLVCQYSAARNTLACALSKGFA
jgi:hypothetical protein